jgi:3-oxoacyl-[acyl-carrier-protein] synthase-3
MTEQFARITGWGKYVPARRLTNYDLEQMVDTNDEWITHNTGIRERRIAEPQETTVDMALNAARVALERASVRSEDLDMVILATSTPDYFCPAAASLLQDRLGARRAAAFDLTSGCTGFLYGLVVASQFIQTGGLSRILVVGAEKLSEAIDYTDRNTSILFGDGAGAVVMEPSQSRTGLLAFELGSDGSAWDALYFPGGGAANPFSQKVLDNREHYLRMDGKRVFKFAAKIMSETVQSVVQRSGVTFDDIDFFIPHQANIRIIDLLIRRLKIDPSKVMVNLDRYGNTSAASMPIALSEAADQDRIKHGDHLVLVGFGAGMTWASAVILWEPVKPDQEAILVSDWPIRDKLQVQAAKMRTAVWSAQVTARSKAQEAGMAVMVPFYTWQRKRRKEREERESEGEQE